MLPPPAAGAQGGPPGRGPITHPTCAGHAQGLLAEPKQEAVSHAEMVEACFRHLQREHRGLPRPGPYFHAYLGWLKQGLPPWQAYTERSALHALANCYLQARARGRHTWRWLFVLLTIPPRDVHDQYSRAHAPL